VTFHGYDATATDDWMRRESLRCRVFLRRRRALKRYGALFIAVSEFTRGKMLERGWPEEKIVVHYIGVDTAFFRPDPAVTRDPVVLFVGRLIEKKGATHLITAMRDVQARVPEAELVLIGHGSRRAQLERQASESGVRARFLGELPPEEVRGWMKRAQVLCAPSVTASNGDSEGLPTVIVEAQAMGLPVVASISAGIPEIVADGVTGFLGREGDVTALTAQLLTVLDDSALRERMGGAGRARVLAHFDLHRQTARLEALYDAARQSAMVAPLPGDARSVTEAVDVQHPVLLR
jgi:glycosyltransferase involved in cell wall biosynthesis